MYKDKDRQREANAERQRRYKAKKALPKGVTSEGVTSKALPEKEWAGNQHISLETNHLINAKPKRGKDIKCFADLSPDVQDTINRLSDNEQEHKRRTAIAIDYQHKHPGRYYSTGAVFTGKMTVMERLFYRPGQRNFVSLPGRACYGVY